MRVKAPKIGDSILVLDSTPQMKLDVKQVLEFDADHDAWQVEGAVPGGSWSYAFWVRERRDALSGKRQLVVYDITAPICAKRTA